MTSRTTNNNANKHRVRGHKYITGLGDGGVKPHITNANNNVVPGGTTRDHRMPLHDLIVKSNNENGEHGDGNDYSDALRVVKSYLRRSYKGHHQSDDQKNSILAAPKENRADHEMGAAFEDWDKLYFPEQQSNADLRNNINNGRMGTGMNDLGQKQNRANFFHINLKPLPQAVDAWHFSAFFAFVATIILIVAVFLSFMSDRFTSSSTLSSDATKKNGTSTTAGGGGGNNSTNQPKKFKPVRRKGKKSIRKPKTDEWNEDYGDDSEPVHERPLLHDSLQPDVTNSIDDLVPIDDPINTTVYYPYQPMAGSFESLTEHPALYQPSTAESPTNYLDDDDGRSPPGHAYYQQRFSDNHPQDTDSMDKHLNVDEFGTEQNYSERREINSPLMPRSTSQNVRCRRPANANSGDIGLLSQNPLISPGSDDLKYLLGLPVDNVDKNLHQNVEAQGKSSTSKSTLQTSSLGDHKHRTPSNTRIIEQKSWACRPSTAEPLDKTPRVTNGRQTIVDDFLDGARYYENSQGAASLQHPKKISFPVISEHTPLPPAMQRAHLSQEGQPSSQVLAAKIPNNSTSNSSASNCSDLIGGFSEHPNMCMQFASPPKLHKEILEPYGFDQINRPLRESSDVPFVPNLFVVPKDRPPMSMNIDDLHLYQSIVLMETGDVSHWKARVAEESRILQDQHNGYDMDKSETSNNIIINANESILSLNYDESEANDNNIRDQVMSAATDLMSSNGTIPSNDPRKSIAHIRHDLTHDTDAASSLQGTIDFTDFKLIDVIGGGGFAQVWRAVWRGTPVAVKVLTGSAQSKFVPKAVLQEFAAEINLLKGMRHPNIVLYMGACIAPPNRAIITELAANGSLWDALRLPLAPPYVGCDGASRTGWPSSLYQPDARHGAPPTLSTPVRPLQSLNSVPPKGTWHWILVKHVARGAARGMAYLHSGKPPILHRDLKSANILLDESYTAKVCDFGLSRLKAHESSMTGNCGTVQWMAPEVLSSERYNEKADVYSYGIICWELLTAECPYDGMTPIQCALAVLNRDLRPDIPRWCPPPLQALIRSCWKRDPALRPSFEQVIAALDSMP